MDTPILEYSEVLLAKAGGERKNKFIKFKKGDTDMCMRFDLTVPFANMLQFIKMSWFFLSDDIRLGNLFVAKMLKKADFVNFINLMWI